MATEFDAAGFDVWVTDVDEAALAAVPSNWTAVRCDASNEAEMAALFARLDGLDVLCVTIWTNILTCIKSKMMV